MAKLGTTDSQVAGYEKLANILDETDKNGIKNALSDLASQLQKLAQNPNSKGIIDIQFFHRKARTQIVITVLHCNRKGIGYYEKSLDSLVATFAETLNKLNESPKIDPATGKPEVDANGDPVMEKHDLFEAIDRLDYIFENQEYCTLNEEKLKKITECFLSVASKMYINSLF